MSEYPRHMIATKATHGDNWKGAYQHDISREDGDLAIIKEYDEELGCYVGSWETGFGLFGVRFDAETTRDLTPKEVLEYEQKSYAINNQQPRQMKIRGYDDVERPQPKIDHTPSVDQVVEDTLPRPNLPKPGMNM